LYFGVEGRWGYGRTAPGDLGPVSLGSLITTANAFGKYKPKPFIIRNLYWEQGSQEAGWAVRAGKITIDGMFGSSSHLTPVTTFLSTASTGPFANALPDSGLGAVGALYFNDRVKLVAGISDANANRQNFGDPLEGDLYKVAELGVKIFPKTPKAGYSKLTVWHNDGTKDGRPINGSNGRPGWGIQGKYEQELTADGRAIAVLRYGKAFNHSALYDQQAGAHLLLYEPLDFLQLGNDVVGAGFNWIDPAATGSRHEYSLEAFYRFPIFPLVDMSLVYQSVINPALAPTIDHASVFSVRVRSTF